MSHSFIQQSLTDDISYPNYFSLAFILVHGYVFILRKEIQLQSIFQFLWYKYSVTIFVKYFSNYRGPWSFRIDNIDITGKKIDNHLSPLDSIISFILNFSPCNLFCYVTLMRGAHANGRPIVPRRFASSPFINQLQ